MYVGRTFFQGDQIPVKVLPSKQAAYVAHNGQEHLVQNYEVLTGHGFTWIGSGNGHVPDGAVSSGNLASGEPIYVGRAHYEGSLTVGKVHKSHGVMYLPFAGSEHSVTQYEVLCGQSRCKIILIFIFLKVL